MGHIIDTPAGTYRANWRDPSGRQRAKTFKTKKAAKAFLAQVEADTSRGMYVDPAAGRTLFRDHAARWAEARSVEATTWAATTSRLRSRLLPYWGSWQLARIDYLAVQKWVTDLGRELAPSTVASLFANFSAIMTAAVRSRLIPYNPCEGVRLPPQRKSAEHDERTIGLDELTGRLLPAVPEYHRALVAAAAGAGLRWGECIGLRWGSVDLDAQTLSVVRVVVEVAGRVQDKPFPKSAAGRRVVPLAPFLEEALRRHRELNPGKPSDPVFLGEEGGTLLRGNFRQRVWRPALVRAGLLGGLEKLGPEEFWGRWTDRTGREYSRKFTTERDAVAYVAANAKGGIRFHDLRHCYATWLISEGIPVNVVQQVMGHEQASTTLNRYTHAPGDYFEAVRRALRDPADFSLTFGGPNEGQQAKGPSEEGS
jgi:integrase